jgi:deazaflavin-dependent oxidoreductase (nitroreductase family)
MAHDALRSFNKKIFNPFILKAAGTPRSPFAVIRHTGRRSGKLYETPLLAMPMGEDFVLALTYGLEVDWYRNVINAGKCILLMHGKEFALEKPELLDREIALLAFPRLLRLILRINRINYFICLKRAVE